MRRSIVLLFLVSCLFSVNSVSAAHTPGVFPRTANYFLKWQLTESEARELALWDLVILDMETQATSPTLIKKMRDWNPRIIILAYVTSQEIRQDAASGSSVMRRRLASRIQPDWYLADARGNRLTWWPGTYLLNMSDAAPTIQGKKMNTVMAEFAAQEIIASGLWDGIFYDNAWDSITAFVRTGIDVDRNGREDTDADLRWQAGMRSLYDETRRLAGKPIILVGNGTTRAYRNQLNGNMIENFIAPAWTPTMRTYAYNRERIYSPSVNIINANTANRGDERQYKTMRFGLASTLMGDGYYSFDYGDTNHGQLWRYDEYETDLGRPVGEASALHGAKDFGVDVWQREFDHGLALVNATSLTEVVELDGEYEKIHGVGDRVVNDGAIVSRVSLPEHDGLLLLKSFSLLHDVAYSNGAFVRFFHADGTRARNGFFAFDDMGNGGDQVGRIDMNGDGKRDSIRATKNKLIATRNDGLLFTKLYPYTANFLGNLSFTVGKQKLLLAPTFGAQPLRFYTYSGERVGADWLPLGATYAFGYTAAVGVVPGAGEEAIVLAPGTGGQPMIRIYGENQRLFREWMAFDASVRGGLFVALGDTNGDSSNEIIVAAMEKKQPRVKVFDARGREQSSFFVVSASGAGVLRGVAAQDVDFDGKDDILVFTE